MTPASIARHRATVQQITSPSLKRPADVVGLLGAMQAQDFAGAKWSIGLRLPGCTEADIDEAIEQGSIIRTWALRGTLHIVAARDVHWLLALLAPRLHKTQAAYYRKYGLTDAAFRKSQDIMRRVLREVIPVRGKSCCRKFTMVAYRSRIYGPTLYCCVLR